MTAAKRVVVDTNTIVSGILLPKSIPRRLFHACRDLNDDKFLDAAYAGNADCLISGDDDLIALREFEGIPILTARQFLADAAR